MGDETELNLVAGASKPNVTEVVDAVLETVAAKQIEAITGREIQESEKQIQNLKEMKAKSTSQTKKDVIDTNIKIVEDKLVKQVEEKEETSLEEIAVAINVPKKTAKAISDAVKSAVSVEDKKKKIEEVLAIPKPPPKPPSKPSKSTTVDPFVFYNENTTYCLGNFGTDDGDTAMALCPVLPDGKCPVQMTSACITDREKILGVLSDNCKISKF